MEVKNINEKLHKGINGDYVGTHLSISLVLYDQKPSMAVAFELVYLFC